MSSNALTFIYGTDEKNINITSKVYSSFVFDNYIVIPSDDNVRAKFFSDPCFGIVKKIYIIGLQNTMTVFDQTHDIFIDTRTNAFVIDKNIQRKLIMKPFEDPVKKLQNLHRFLTLKQGSMKHEFPEQCMLVQFLTGCEKVLEIGGNIGRASLVIASLLENGNNHVVLESSTVISEHLKTNRNINDFVFHVENAALSLRPLIQKGWNTIQSDVLLKDYTSVPIISYNDINKKYNIEFDTLVLDCEGAFYYILQDFPDMLDSLQTIIVENDYKIVEHKKYVDDMLIKGGFNCVFTKQGEAEARLLQFPFVENFYEVWKKPAKNIKNITNELIIPTVFGGKFMSSYPSVFFFRYDEYKSIDMMFHNYKEKIDCSIQIINNVKPLSAMLDPNYNILVTYGKDRKRYVDEIINVLPDRLRKRWIHLDDIETVESFVYKVNYCYINNVILDRELTRVNFSIFTTCYNSYDKINRVYNSILKQRYLDWEWVILDDSPDDLHFDFLRKRFSLDLRVRLYKRSSNSGSIGNVKNEAVSLCRGKYVLEMDHDDEILPNVLEDSVRTFQENSDVGFIYMDFINVYENLKNFRYSDFICKGYGGYYRQKYNNRWVEVYITPNINNVTLSHIVCLPNHPRIWRKETLLKIGNYSEFLPICDDQELLMRTAINTKMVKIPKLGYVQYMNEGNNNFSLIRNKEINRLGPKFIVPQFYKMYDVHGKMKELGAYENEDYITKHKQIWKRTNYVHKYCNMRIQYDYDTQYCIVGLEQFYKNLELLKEAYKNNRNDFILLEGNDNKDALCKILDDMNFDRMKCYSMPNTPNEELISYFHNLYKSCEKTIILTQVD